MRFKPTQETPIIIIKQEPLAAGNYKRFGNDPDHTRADVVVQTASAHV
jgi:hypothetical protein